MGVYNTIEGERICPHCQMLVPDQVQFKYGETYLHTYRLGDSLIWSSINSINIGTPGHKLVVVDSGHLGCPNCRLGGEDCEVWIENDIIVSIQPFSDNYLFADEIFVVVED